jgi:hypothetical protein
MSRVVLQRCKLCGPDATHSSRRLSEEPEIAVF